MAQLNLLKALILDPLRGGAHQVETVPEWDGAKIVVRPPTAGDYATWRLAIREAAHVHDDDDQPTAVRKIEAADLGLASAALLVRVLYDAPDKGAARRVLSDEDVPLLAASWTPVHERLLALSLKLSGVPDEETAKNSLAESPTSA